MIRIGVIGYGYWGPNVARNFHENPISSVEMIADSNPARLRLAQKRYPGVRLTTDCHEVIKDSKVDTIAIVTPVSTHYELVREALLRGKDVLVAKPLATSTSQAETLVDLAKREGRVLAVDHTFLYHGAVRKIKELIESGELGEVLYYDSTRVSLGLVQHDVNVLWDLAAHDVAILDYLFPMSSVVVLSKGASHVGALESIGYVIIEYPGRLLAHVHVNWLAPVKVRMILIGGRKKMILYDDLEPSDKVKIYDKSVTIGSEEDRYSALVQYRIGDMRAPRIDMTEALQVECEDFLRCVQTRNQPVANGEHAIRTVQVLEAAQQSIAQGGKEIYVRL